jgi:hypothetical protein
LIEAAAEAGVLAVGKADIPVLMLMMMLMMVMGMTDQAR